MPTYVYETVPERAGQRPRRFEVQQRMSDPALTVDPDSGLPVRRVFTPVAVIGSAEEPSCGSDCGLPGSDYGACGPCCPPR